jgi:hypothetical protein
MSLLLALLTFFTYKVIVRWRANQKRSAAKCEELKLYTITPRKERTRAIAVSTYSSSASKWKKTPFCS